MLYSVYAFSVRIVFALRPYYNRTLIPRIFVLRWCCVRIVFVVYSYWLGVGLVVHWYCSGNALVLCSCRIRIVSHVVNAAIVLFCFDWVSCWHCFGIVMVLCSCCNRIALYVCLIVVKVQHLCVVVYAYCARIVHL